MREATMNQGGIDIVHNEQVLWHCVGGNADSCNQQFGDHLDMLLLDLRSGITPRPIDPYEFHRCQGDTSERARSLATAINDSVVLSGCPEACDHAPSYADLTVILGMGVSILVVFALSYLHSKLKGYRR